MRLEVVNTRTNKKEVHFPANEHVAENLMFKLGLDHEALLYVNGTYHKTWDSTDGSFIEDIEPT